jgi:uncharacterized protein (TIGR02594 family)
MTAFELASRYVGIHELASGDHPLIQWWLSLCGMPTDVKDETPWCSAFANGIAWELRLPRSKSAAARSWLAVGEVIGLEQARPENDVVILKRGQGQQPGPEVVRAQGHVGFFAGTHGDYVMVLAGNQGDAVSVKPFSVGLVLGVRRLSAVV